MLVNKITLKENLDLRATDNKAQKGYESSVRLSFSQVNLPIVENIVPWECSWSLNYSHFFSFFLCQFFLDQKHFAEQLQPYALLLNIHFHELRLKDIRNTSILSEGLSYGT